MSRQVVVLSPHLDDGVLSCGQLLAGRPGSLVVTVCTAPPPEHRVCTSVDANCGFANAGQAMAARQQEDTLACWLLQAHQHHLGHVDQQYGRQLLPAAVAADLVAVLPAGAVVVGPLGLAHPDHIAVAEAMRLALEARGDLEPWVYEDLPSRVLWPEQVPERLGWWRAMGYDPVHADLGGAALSAKEAAVRAYRSQLWALDLHTVLVPERHWRLWPQT